jgi:F0F1-type ATP synthase assembly protein I
MKCIIEATACIIMVGGLLGIFIERATTKRGIGVRVIQLATVMLVIPAIIILSLESILSEQTTGTLVGAIVGYVLSGIGKDEPTKSNPSST